MVVCCICFLIITVGNYTVLCRKFVQRSLNKSFTFHVVKWMFIFAA